MKLLHYDHAWPETFNTCPCDRDFTDWLAATPEVQSATIFHFGTGAHHHVGQVAQLLGHRVIGLTASRQEMDAYEQLVIERPDLAHAYQAVFGDIYLLNPNLLPMLDVVTLFHLCEFTDSRRAEYGGCSDAEVCRRLLAQMYPGAYLLAYPGSMAWPQARPILEELVTQGVLLEPTPWRSLLVYRRGWA